jgi:ATP-dependent Zn protease
MDDILLEGIGAMVVLEKGRGRAVGPRRQSSEREHTAFHEAGHAVVAEALGIGGIKRVSMVATDTSWGHVVHELPPWISEVGYDMTASREVRLHRHIMVCLGGAAAIAIRTRRRTWHGSSIVNR